MHHLRRGSGKPLLLVHGLGGTWQSWNPMLDTLAAEREVIAVDLPGFGETPPLPGPLTLAALTDALQAFMTEHGLTGVDTVGSSMGARMVLELARRGVGGTAVSLDPGGFWSEGELRFFGVSLHASIKLLWVLHPALPALLANPVGRTALPAQFSARPWALSQEVTLTELQSFIDAPAFDRTLDALVASPPPEGGPTPGRVVLGWGRQDRVTLPRQAARVQRAFPHAELHWFDHCGHFPQWDAPDETARLVLRNTA